MARRFPELKPQFDFEEAKNVLGYPRTVPLDEKTLKEVEEARKEAQELVNPRGLYEEVEFFVSEDAVEIRCGDRTYLLTSRRLAQRLKGSKSGYIFIVTIGEKVEERVQELMSKGEYSKALMFDAVGSAFVEGLAEEAQKYLASISKPHLLTYRFSPGYGDLDLAVQKVFFEILGPQEIGVTLTKKMMMKPRKTVTAVCGKLLEDA